MIKKTYFAGGCFWCTESIFQRVKGVSSVIPGYMGGSVKKPTYREVCSGKTGHTETIRINYDDSIVSFEELLLIFFLTHDPTTMNRQGNDIGSQYRSAIFYNDKYEKDKIKDCISKLENEGIYKNPFVTEVHKLTRFYKAEVEHQNYFNNNEFQPYCQIVIKPKIDKFKSLFIKNCI